jgi:hypothetical protein
MANTRVTFTIREEWEPLLIAAHSLIVEVMTAGALQRQGDENANDGWRKLDPVQRVHKMFMHLVATQTHMGTHQNPWSLTGNTHLEDYKHATMGGIIVKARTEPESTVLQETIDE